MPTAPADPVHERIRDAIFRRAVDLLDAGDVAGLRDHLRAHPDVVHQRITLDGPEYFIGRSRMPMLVLAGLFLVMMMVNHYVLEWDALPAWYNVVVPFVIAAAILLGGRLRRATSGT